MTDWPLQHRRGKTYHSILKDRIIELGPEIGLRDGWLKKILDHVISGFSKKGLATDYYGYHGLDHELEAAYFTLLAANGQTPDVRFTQQEIHYLFVAALLHNYDLLKQFDKPFPDGVERCIRNDNEIRRYINGVGLNLELAIALIHLAADSFRGDNAEQAKDRIERLFDGAGIPKNDAETRRRYEELGSFLSMTKRVGGYALGDFERASDLARRHAHSLGWHVSVVNERSAKYFSSLSQEKEVFDRVMSGIPEEYRRRFSDNVAAFNERWKEESTHRDLMNRRYHR